MRSRLIIFSLVILSAGCNGLGVRDTTNGKPISLNDLKDLPGTWYATEHTYKTLKEKDYKIDSITLILKRDSSFELVNTPDCINDGAGESKNHLLATTTGNWEIEQVRDRFYLLMTFNKGRIFETRTTMNFDIGFIYSILTIRWFIGDPDQADIMMFRKRQ